MNEKVNVYVKLENGKWELMMKDVDEKVAIEIWHSVFKTGENRISIETEMSRRIAEMNRKALGL